MVPLTAYLIVAALLFCIGMYAVLARRNAIAILMGVELMLNAVNINLVAFWRFLTPSTTATGSGLQVGMAGQTFAIFVFVVAAAEAAVGLALILSVFRNRRTVIAENVDSLKL
ncbi:MAG: NADH-quinone oxidoreductase subunit NuoK [Anaerolinea sp.]|nr:NADH-quinone oxidoreductase subunit NuoK [Anaerolinea sp.]MCC6975089.1 NADH-quinone oxidoreductase subunit NuoK [Anaerolineae bacterium]CAG1001402.1 NADH-quinone oxidoreductase subunit K [Anaerolineae bacterium]